MNLKKITTSFVLVAIGIPLFAPSANAENNHGTFRYDAAQGICVDSDNEKGYNKVDIDYLFSLDTLDDGKSVYLNKEAECVDFSNFDFYLYTKMSNTAYATLLGWNLKGANLNNASLFFAYLDNPRLAGAQMSKLNMGYAYINNSSIDQYTNYTFNDYCELKNQLLMCSEQIKFKLNRQQ